MLYVHIFIYLDTIREKVNKEKLNVLVCITAVSTILSSAAAETSRLFRILQLWTETSESYILGPRNLMSTYLGQRRASLLRCALRIQILDKDLPISYLKEKIGTPFSYFCLLPISHSVKEMWAFPDISDHCKPFLQNTRTSDLEILPLNSISWMHMSTTMGRVVLCALTSVVRSQLNTFFILRRSGWQSLGTSLEHCLCTFNPQSIRARGR